MVDLRLFIAGVFLFGIARSASTCALLCAPGMLPYIVVKKLSYWESLRLALLFNLPRIILLTALGAVIGYLTVAAGQGLDLKTYTRPLGITGYLLMGLILAGGGAWVLWKGGDYKNYNEKNRSEAADDDNVGGCKTKKVIKKKHNSNYISVAIQDLISKTVDNSPALFFLLGGLLSIACLGELVLLEGTVISGFAASEFGGAAPAIFGAFTMFVFAIGATIPIIAVSAVGSGVARVKRVRKMLDKVRDLAGVMLVIIGLALIFWELKIIFQPI